MFFFFQAEDGIRDGRVTGVQTCALPISLGGRRDGALLTLERRFGDRIVAEVGYRHAAERTAPADSATVGATPNRTSAIRGRLSLQLLDRQRASVFGEFEQDILEARQRRATVGGEYMIARRARLYARHELIS